MSSPEQKKEIVDYLLKIWNENPEYTLGRLIVSGYGGYTGRQEHNDIDAHVLHKLYIAEDDRFVRNLDLYYLND